MVKLIRPDASTTLQSPDIPSYPDHTQPTRLDFIRDAPTPGSGIKPDTDPDRKIDRSYRFILDAAFDAELPYFRGAAQRIPHLANRSTSVRSRFQAGASIDLTVQPYDLMLPRFIFKGEP
jgi:hypothetical protein